MDFEALGLDERVLEGLASMGYKEATPIQEQAIPIILQGHDLLGCAQTGTGKTAAFLLPILNKLAKAEKESTRTSVLIIAPTRELVLQIDQQIEGFAYFLPVTSRAIYGGGDGSDWVLQRGALDAGADILVAAPGRLLYFMQLKHTDFSSIDTLVLDEADRMLDMGFLPVIQQIIAELPKVRQTLFFSATMPPQVRTLAKQILRDPRSVDIAVSKPAEGIIHWCFTLQKDAKLGFILEYFRHHTEFQSAILFVRKKEDVRTLVRRFNRAGIGACGISSDLEQAEREKSLQDFKARTVTVLIATDILSRGIDIEEVNIVVNYDVPRTPEDYVHRVGRTARANATGVALTLVAADELYSLRRIERLLEKPLDLLQEEWTVPFITHFTDEEKSRRAHHSSRPKRTATTPAHRNKRWHKPKDKKAQQS